MTGAVRALVAVEVKRQAPQFIKLAAMMGVILAVAVATGGVEGNGFAAGLAGSLLLGLPAFSSLRVMQDRVDGTLEFFCSLPVSGDDLARARFHVLAALAAIAALLNVGALHFSGGAAALPLHPLVTSIGALALGWAIPMAVGAVTCALGTRYRMETVLTLPFVLIFGLAVLGDALSARIGALLRYAPLERVLLSSWFAPIAVAVALLACMAVIHASFRVTSRSMSTFRPAPDLK